MKKLLIISGCLFLAGIYSCDGDRSEKKEAEMGTAKTDQPADSVSVPPLNSTTAKDMIKHYKSDSVSGNRGKLFRGGMDMTKLTAILQGATSFNIYAAAYPGNYPDSSKRNMPTYVLQVRKSVSGAENTTLYFAIEKEQFCPPPPICYEAIETYQD